MTTTMTPPGQSGWQSLFRAGRAGTRRGLMRRDIRFQAVGVDQWRVLNDALASEDVDALLGFVEHHGDVWEVTVLTSPGTVTRHPDEESARLRFCDPACEPVPASLAWSRR